MACFGLKISIKGRAIYKKPKKKRIKAPSVQLAWSHQTWRVDVIAVFRRRKEYVHILLLFRHLNNLEDCLFYCT